jgi:hypothetical protein
MEIKDAASRRQVDITSLREWTAGRIWEWSSACGEFLKWERDHLLLREAAPEDRKEHKVALDWLLRLTRLLYAAVSAPDFPDHSARKALRGRLRQLEDSWQMFYENTLTRTEADEQLLKIFPDYPSD